MISLWLFAWLFHYVAMTPDVWYSFPLIMTALCSVALELIGYAALVHWYSE